MSILSGDYVVGRLLAILPEVETVSLYTLGTDGNVPSSGVPWQAKREEADLNDLVMAGVESSDSAIVFTLIDNIVTATLTLTVVGTIVDAGNAVVTVTAAGMTNSPKDVTFAVLAGDTAAQVAGKARTALAADADVNAFFSVSGTSATVTLTQRISTVEDPTMAASIDNDTCTGLTAASATTSTARPTPPAVKDKITDAVGVSWAIARITTKLFKRVHRCTCIQYYE